MFCSSCGHKNNEQFQFCAKCGNPLQSQSTSSDQTSSQGQASQPQVINISQTHDANQTVTMGDWFIFKIVMMIPPINLIMYLVWAFSDRKPSRANLCKLNLLIWLIFTVIGGIGWLIAFAVFGFSFSDFLFF